jgi:hypothetical protein
MIAAMILSGLLVLIIGVFQLVLTSNYRHDLYFSISVPAQFRQTSEARAIKQRFRIQMLSGIVVAEGLTTVGVYTGSFWLLVAATATVSAVCILPYSWARDRASHFRMSEVPERTASLDGEANGVALLALFSGLIPFIAAGVFTYLQRDNIYDWMAFGIAVAAYGWIGLVLLVCGLAVLLGARRAGMLRAINLKVIAGLSWVNSATAAAFIVRKSDAPLDLVFPNDDIWSQVFHLASLILVSAIIVWGYRKASRLSEPRDITPDGCWKLGQFYYNPEDPAFIVESRLGLGYSPNFAKSLSWAACAALVLLPIFALAALVIVSA